MKIELLLFGLKGNKSYEQFQSKINCRKPIKISKDMSHLTPLRCTCTIVTTPKLAIIAANPIFIIESKHRKHPPLPFNPWLLSSIEGGKESA